MTCLRLASGETLSSYCKRNNLSYAAIFKRIDEKGMSIDEAIKNYIPRKGRLDNHVKYFYKGQSLYAYFKQNTKVYQRCRNLIRAGMSIEEAIKAVE